MIGVQNLNEPTEKIDPSFTITFYNTEIIQSRVKPSISSRFLVNEGEPVDFSVLGEAGNFPIESIIKLTSLPIINYTNVEKCGDKFHWIPSYDVVKETYPEKQKVIKVQFIGSTKFQIRDNR